MKKTLTLLAASTALTATVGLSAWSAMTAPADAAARPFAALFDERGQALPLVLASDDDDDRDRDRSRRGYDDDDDDDHDDGDDDDDDEDDDDDDDHDRRDSSRREHDDDDDDDDDRRRGARTPAPAGTALPPPNGLFEGGTPPKVQVN